MSKRSGCDLTLMIIPASEPFPEELWNRNVCAIVWNYRDARYAQVMVAADPDIDKMEDAKQWCRSYWEALYPYSAGGAYTNFMMEEGDDRVKKAYGENYERLAKVKAKYDPDNFFRVNQNIKPE
jgi:FAD/FMN-containing dehydrogenase